MAAAVGENLPLRRLVVEQDVEGGILVRFRALVEGAKDMENVRHASE